MAFFSNECRSLDFELSEAVENSRQGILCSDSLYCTGYSARGAITRGVAVECHTQPSELRHNVRSLFVITQGLREFIFWSFSVFREQ